MPIRGIPTGKSDSRRTPVGFYPSGFTLIEMLVSLGIFAVITGVVIANFHGGNQGDELRAAVQLTASAVRHAQTSAIGSESVSWCVGGANNGKTCLGGTGGECPSGSCVRDIPKGYGVRFSSSGAEASMAISFADINGNGAFDAGEEMRRDRITVSSSVAVSTLAPSFAAVLDIVFSPPRPTVTFNATAPDAIAVITIRHSATGATKAVTVNKVSGQVNID